jgi:hypothetical protein
MKPTYVQGINKIIVKLAGKTVGHIKTVAGGYQYFPLGKTIGGDVYASVQSVQRSLETEEN